MELKQIEKKNKVEYLKTTTETEKEKIKRVMEEARKKQKEGLK